MKEKDNEDDKRKIYLGDKMCIQNVMKVGVKNYSVYILTAKPGDNKNEELYNTQNSCHLLFKLLLKVLLFINY